MEVIPMGEKTEFRPGEEAPNDGVYREIGENDIHMGINDPLHIHLKAGERFPETSNHNRKWAREPKPRH
jgi:hypothetical protein